MPARAPPPVAALQEAVQLAVQVAPPVLVTWEVLLVEVRWLKNHDQLVLLEELPLGNGEVEVEEQAVPNQGARPAVP